MGYRTAHSLRELTLTVWTLILSILMLVASVDTIVTHTRIYYWQKVSEIRAAKILKLQREDEARRNAEYSILVNEYPWLTRSLYSTVVQSAFDNNLDPHFVLSVIQAESQGERFARGPIITGRDSLGRPFQTRALGLMQLIPEYHYNGNRNDLFDPATNIRIGTKYLRYCLTVAGGNRIVALKNYNSGPGSGFYNTPYIEKILARYDRTSTLRSKITI